MEESIPSYWSPEAFNTDVLTPVALLRVQASKLGEATRGILTGEVHTLARVGKEAQITHNLDVIAPALDNYKERFLVVRHRRDMVYPVEVESMLGTFRAETEGQFRKLLRDVLGSDVVTGRMQSLIARSNEIKVTPETGSLTIGGWSPEIEEHESDSAEFDRTQEGSDLPGGSEDAGTA